MISFSMKVNHAMGTIVMPVTICSILWSGIGCEEGQRMARDDRKDTVRDGERRIYATDPTPPFAMTPWVVIVASNDHGQEVYVLARMTNRVHDIRDLDDYVHADTVEELAQKIVTMDPHSDVWRMSEYSCDAHGRRKI